MKKILVLLTVVAIVFCSFSCKTSESAATEPEPAPAETPAPAEAPADKAEIQPELLNAYREDRCPPGFFYSMASSFSTS